MTLTVAVTGRNRIGQVDGLAASLGDCGAVVIDSDRLAREVVAPGTPGLAAVADEFGPEMIGAGRRAGSGRRWPRWCSPIRPPGGAGGHHPPAGPGRVRPAATRRRGGAVVVNDIPLLTTLAAAAGFHLVVGVGAAEETRVQRLVGRGLTDADARARIRRRSPTTSGGRCATSGSTTTAPAADLRSG